MLNTAESAGEREAGGDPAHLSERRRNQLAMSKRWTEELEKGTTSRSNLTTAAPRKVQWSSGLTIRVGDMVRVAPCLGDGKVNPRHCHGGDGYVVSVTVLVERLLIRTLFLRKRRRSSTSTLHRQ